jgi:hypothetical protein
MIIHRRFSNQSARKLGDLRKTSRRSVKDHHPLTGDVKTDSRFQLLPGNRSEGRGHYHKSPPEIEFMILLFCQSAK